VKFVLQMLEYGYNRTGGVGFVLYIFSSAVESRKTSRAVHTAAPLATPIIIAGTVSDESARLQLKLATKANFPQFFVTLKRVITQTPRLPFEVATVMLIRIVYVTEWRQPWETNH
jgi:hypothetical protein